MLPTQSGGPGAFAQFDLKRVPTPCYVVDEEKIRSNLRILRDIGELSGAKFFLPSKLFRCGRLPGLIEEYLGWMLCFRFVGGKAGTGKKHLPA